MAEIIANEGGGKKKGKRRAKKHSTHIDMTPMVDLFCLLLTFFMLTTAFSKPKVMEIALPEKDPKIKGAEIPGWRTLSIILDENDKIYWYTGNANPLKPPLPEIHETDYSKDGIRKLLLHRNKDLFTQIENFNQDLLKGKIKLPKDSINERLKQFRRADKAGPIVLIKSTEKAKYGNMVDIVDEMSITNIAVYTLVDMNKIEKKMLEFYKASVKQP
jgi:biopolymer transport protein ExbD